MGCIAYFYIYLGHIMQKNIIYLSHVTFRSTVRCHILRKLPIFDLTRGVKNFKMGHFRTIWKKQPHVALRICIYEGNMRLLFSICQYKCPILKFLTLFYFRDMFYFQKVHIICVIIKSLFIEKIIGLASFLSSFWPNNLVSVF